MVEYEKDASQTHSENHLIQILNSSKDDVKIDNSNCTAENKDFFDFTEKPVLYKRRWLMVFLFAFYSASSSFQWIHLNIIADKMLIFYEPSLPESPQEQDIAIDWLSMVYMLGYILFMFPSSWLLDRYGLYVVGIMGTLLNCIGAWIKCAAIHPDRFYLLMSGQCICAIAQAFILGLPARLAAVWFGPNEVSTATAIGVFGNQIGCAIGFLIPPMIVPFPPDCVFLNTSTESRNSTTNAVLCDDIPYLTSKLRILLYGTAVVTTTLCILVIIFFTKRPLTPPSLAQMVAQKQNSREGKRSNMDGFKSYVASIFRLVTYVPFLLLFITYGINVGSYYAIGTLLNPIILEYFPTDQIKAGWIGLTLVLSGVIGSILSGIWLDRTKLFKSTTLLIYCLSAIGMLAFTLVLLYDNIDIVFVTSFVLGFFMTGYLPVGFEFAAEITFPESEGTSSGLLNVSAQVFGILFTIISRAMGTVFMGNIFITILLFIGSITTAFIKADLKRQKAHERISKICVIETITNKEDSSA